MVRAKETGMRQRNWTALAIYAVVVIALGAVLWTVFVDRDEAPGATGSVPGAATSATGAPVTPETPGQPSRAP